MDALTSHQKVLPITNSMIRKPTLPHRRLRSDTMREPTLDQTHGPLKGDLLRRQQQLNVIRHDDKSMQLVKAFSTIVLKRFQEQFAIRRDLK